ncbi:MAG: peptidylprolyl isomerase [Pirellulaceae bacterium]
MSRLLLTISCCLVAAGFGSVLSAQQTVAPMSPESARLASEVSIAINPTNLENLVAGSLIRGYPESSAPDVSYYSMDGGKTWETVPVPNPDDRTQGDDVVLFSRDGTCVHAFISFVGLWQEFPERAASGILLCRSTDGGKTWSEQVTVADHINTKTPMEDKPWLVFDNSTRSPHRGNLYCTWTRFDVYGSDDPQDTTQIMFARSGDGGESFDPVIRISDQGGDCVDDDNTVEGAVPCTSPDGTIYVVWAGPRGMEFDMSTDGGTTFGEDRVIMDMPGGWSSEVDGVSRHNGMPVTGVDHSPGPHQGSIYVNWIDERNDDKDVFLMASRDGGETWSDAIRVNDDPEENGRDQFFTWMAVDPADGSINIAFYDRRDTEGTNARLTLARSVDGGAAFTNIPVDFPEFDCSAEGEFFGDYIGIDAQRGRVAIAFMNMDEAGKIGLDTAVFDFRPGTVELKSESETGNAGEPDYITVQHILVGFEGSVGDKEIGRSQDEAEKLAGELLERARSGEDFDALVKEFTDDQHPGIYQMANFYSQGDMSPEEVSGKIFPRSMMVNAFGDIGFPLDVGEIGMADYDPQTSKYGWHIIKRIK